KFRDEGSDAVQRPVVKSRGLEGKRAATITIRTKAEHSAAEPALAQGQGDRRGVHAARAGTSLPHRRRRLGAVLFTERCQRRIDLSDSCGSRIDQPLKLLTILEYRRSAAHCALRHAYDLGDLLLGGLGEFGGNQADRPELLEACEV